MSNKSQGNTFENEFCNILSHNGFWCHRLQDNKNGQPADIIAAKYGRSFLIDCKDCTGTKFELRRIEENQKNAMRLFEECGNQEGLFAIRYADGEIYIIYIQLLLRLMSAGIKAVNEKDMNLFGFKLEDWYSRSMR